MAGKNRGLLTRLKAAYDAFRAQEGQPAAQGGVHNHIIINVFGDDIKRHLTEKGLDLEGLLTRTIEHAQELLPNLAQESKPPEEPGAQEAPAPKERHGKERDPEYAKEQLLEKAYEVLVKDGHIGTGNLQKNALYDKLIDRRHKVKGKVFTTKHHFSSMDELRAGLADYCRTAKGDEESAQRALRTLKKGRELSTTSGKEEEHDPRDRRERLENYLTSLTKGQRGALQKLAAWALHEEKLQWRSLTLHDKSLKDRAYGAFHKDFDDVMKAVTTYHVLSAELTDSRDEGTLLPGIKHLITRHEYSKKHLNVFGERRVARSAGHGTRAVHTKEELLGICYGILKEKGKIGMKELGKYYFQLVNQKKKDITIEKHYENLKALQTSLADYCRTAKGDEEAARQALKKPARGAKRHESINVTFEERRTLQRAVQEPAQEEPINPEELLAHYQAGTPLAELIPPARYINIGYRYKPGGFKAAGIGVRE